MAPSGNDGIRIIRKAPFYGFELLTDVRNLKEFGHIDWLP